MMKQWNRSVLIAGTLVAAICLPSLAVLNVTWTEVGTSGFTNGVGMQDFDRAKINYLIEDDNGVIYATAQIGDNLGVINPSFEAADATADPYWIAYADGTTADGWTYNSSGGSSASGVENVVLAGQDPASDGDNVAWMNDGSVTCAAPLGIYVPGTYTLEVDVRSIPGYTPTSYNVEMLGNGSPIATGVSATLPAISNSWQTATVSVTIDGSHPNLYNAISFRFSCVGIQLQVDNVRLTQPSSTGGGLTIYTPAGGGTYTKQDVAVADQGFPGGITKLVKAGDGKIYGLQNWMEIKWMYGRGYDQHILRIDPDGTLTPVFTAPTASDDATRVVDITVGADGNIYFSRHGGSNYWKYHMFFRVVLFGAGAPYVEESPRGGLYNEGWLQKHRYYPLHAVGVTNGIESFFLASVTDPNQVWRGTALGWDKINGDAMYNWYYRRYDNLTNQYWFRNERTSAGAYDPVRKIVWMGGQSYRIDSFWSANGGSSAVVDLGGGNKGLQSSRSSSDTQAGWKQREWYNGGYGIVTLAAKFRVDSYDPGYDGCFMGAAGSPWSAAGGGDTNALVGVRILNEAGTDNLVLWNASTASKIVTLGPVVDNATWHEVHIVANSQTDTAKCWYNGSPAYDGAVTAPDDGHDGALFAVGAGVQGLSPASGLSATVTFDDFAAKDGEYTGPLDATWPAVPMGPNDSRYGNYQNGSGLPENYRINAAITRWTGDASAPSLFKGVGVSGQNPNPITGIDNEFFFAANNNNPDTTNITNGDHFWPSAMAVNPCNGACWYSFSATPNYNQDSNAFAPMGQFVAALPLDAYPTETVTPPGDLYTSMIVGVHFGKGNKVYALVYDLVDGTYTTYVGDNPNGGECCPIPFADTDGDKDVDMVDFGKWQRCYTLDSAEFDALNCACFDRDYNNIIDDADLFDFEDCASASGVPANEDCGN